LIFLHAARTSTSTFKDEKIPLIIALSALLTLLIVVLVITYFRSRRQKNGQQLQSSISATESAMSQLSTQTTIAVGWNVEGSIRRVEAIDSSGRRESTGNIMGYDARDNVTEVDLGTMTISNTQTNNIMNTAIDMPTDTAIDATSYMRSFVTTDTDNASYNVTLGTSSPTITSSTTLPPLSNNSMTISRSATMSRQRTLPRVSMLQIEPMTRRLTVNLGEQGRSIVVRDTDAGGTDHVVNVVSLRPETPQVPGLKKKLMFWK
jgi:hypothetical protein